MVFGEEKNQPWEQFSSLTAFLLAFQDSTDLRRVGSAFSSISARLQSFQEVQVSAGGGGVERLVDFL